MKKFFYFFALSAFVFAGCSDDDDNAGNGGDNGSDELRKISVTSSEIVGLPASAGIDQVRFYVERITSNDHLLTYSDWNSGFALTLPTSVTNTYLVSIRDFLAMGGDTALDGITITDSNTRITANTYIEAYDDDDEYVADLKILDGDEEWEIRYIYADRDVTVKGAHQFEDNDWISADLQIKPGWNRFAYRTSENVNKQLVHEIKTGLPSGLKWHYKVIE